ncbi:DUF1630-domain-containing protein [Salix suchowensis]|nr:DUF1630-domain-containing protein [Salix suchowensis]
MFGIGSGSDPANGGFGTYGWKSRSYKRYISKDRSLLKKLEDAWKGGIEREQVEATLLLRQHFNTRTRELLLPLTRYLNTLIPSPAELAASSRLRGSPHQTPTFTPSMASLVTPLESQSPASSRSSLGTSISAAAPRLKPFSRTAFFASLKDHGCLLPFRSAKQRIQFYERWLKCKAFGIWLAKQEEIVRFVLQKEKGGYSTWQRLCPEDTHVPNSELSDGTSTIVIEVERLCVLHYEYTRGLNLSHANPSYTAIMRQSLVIGGVRPLVGHLSNRQTASKMSIHPSWERIGAPRSCVILPSKGQKLTVGATRRWYGPGRMVVCYRITVKCRPRSASVSVSCRCSRRSAVWNGRHCLDSGDQPVNCERP